MESLSFIIQDILYKLNAFLVEFFGSRIGEAITNKVKLYNSSNICMKQPNVIAIGRNPRP